MRRLLTSDRSYESGTTEHADGDTPINRVEQIRQQSTNDSQRSRSKEPAQETTYKDRLKVLSNSNRNLEDGKDKETNEKRKLASIEFRERAPMVFESELSKWIPSF